MTAVPSPHSETWELVRRAQDQEQDAREELFRRFAAWVRPMVDRRVDATILRREDADDVVDSCLREALGALPRLRRRADGQLFGWLLTIVVRKLGEKADYHRAQKRRSPVQNTVGAGGGRAPIREPLAMAPTPATGAAHSEELERLVDALAGLTSDQVELIGYVHYLDLPYRDIGDMLGIAPAAVQKRVERALGRLRRAYGARD